MNSQKMYTLTVFFFSLFSFFTTFAQNYPAVFDPNTLTGKNGFIVKGLNKEDRLGFEVNFIGDINNDDLEDIAISSLESRSDAPYGGTAYVIFGSRNPYPSPFDVTTLNGTNGFKVEGIFENEGRAQSVGKLGDVNGDGIDDAAFSSSRRGAIILYGKTGAFPAVITKGVITGTNGFIFDQIYIGEVKNAGDVNGDGINDIVIGQAGGGGVYIVFGKNGGFPDVIGTSWLDGVKGFILGGVIASRAGYYVNTAGDINGDGFDDVMIGIWAGSSPGQNLTYVYFGHAAPFTTIVDMRNVTGADGFSIENKAGNFLVAVGPLGDINGDGIDDCFSRSNIIFGTKNGFAQKFIPDGINGFACAGFNQTSSAIGDVNADGIDDFIVAANSSENWVVYGSRQAFPVEFDPTVLDGTKGFKIKNLSQTNIGRQVSGNGDINGDGLSDFMIGSEYGLNFKNDKGETYIIFGGDHYALPLTTTYPKASNSTSIGFTLQLNAQEKGKIHYAVYSGTALAVTQTSAILNGTNAIQYGEVAAATASTSINKVLTGLTSGTAYDVYVYFEDEKGNTGQIYKLDDVTITSQVSDTEAPVITACVGDQPSLCGAALPDYTTQVTATDNIDNNITITQSPLPGTAVSVTTEVIITATDDVGNHSMCSFYVLFEKSLSCPGDQTSTDGLVQDYTGLAMLEGYCGGVKNITQQPAAGTPVTDGMVIVLKVTDNDDNQTSCAFSVYTLTTAVALNQNVSNAFTVYPNPATGIVQVRGGTYDSYEVLDNLGSVVLQGTTDTEINVGAVNSGMYMILFYDAARQLIATKKIIKH